MWWTFVVSKGYHHDVTQVKQRCLWKEGSEKDKQVILLQTVGSFNRALLIHCPGKLSQPPPCYLFLYKPWAWIQWLTPQFLPKEAHCKKSVRVPRNTSCSSMTSPLIYIPNGGFLRGPIPQSWLELKQPHRAEVYSFWAGPYFIVLQRWGRGWQKGMR